MTTHNMRNTPEYAAWRRMKSACYDLKSRQFARYGGSGVRVCPEWKASFLKFYEDMGPMPEDCNGLQLLNFDAPFCKLNARWTWNERGRPKKLKPQIKRAKPKGSIYKRVQSPVSICLVLESDLVQFIRKMAMHKSLEEGYFVSANDLMRDSLSKAFQRRSQTDLFK